MMTSGQAVKYKNSMDCATSLEERRIHVLDEGSWSQHPPWCCRRWCTCWIRQIQGIIHCLQIGLIYLVRYLHSLQSLFHADINIILSVHIFIKMKYCGLINI